MFQKHIQSPPWEDWKGGLGGLLKTLWRTARGVKGLNCDVNNSSRHTQDGEDDRHLRWEEGATRQGCQGSGLRVIHEECL